MRLMSYRVRIHTKFDCYSVSNFLNSCVLAFLKYGVIKNLGSVVYDVSDIYTTRGLLK